LKKCLFALFASIPFETNTALTEIMSVS